MGVVFDEVTTTVEAPPQPPTPQREPGETERPQPCEKLRWEQLQACFQRRQLRLEAD